MGTCGTSEVDVQQSGFDQSPVAALARMWTGASDSPSKGVLAWHTFFPVAVAKL
jgi:hypothetical protein